MTRPCAQTERLLDRMTEQVTSLCHLLGVRDDTIAALAAENDQLRASLAAADELIAWHGEGVR